jgi:hypothetical protein
MVRRVTLFVLLLSLGLPAVGRAAAAGDDAPLTRIAFGSSLNRPFVGASEQGPHQLGPVYWPENFGKIDIDWRAREATIAIRDIGGEGVRWQAFALAD